jgi:hypothetical protein
MPLAYQALFVPDPRTLKQYASLLGFAEEKADRSRVVRVPLKMFWWQIVQMTTMWMMPFPP